MDRAQYASIANVKPISFFSNNSDAKQDVTIRAGENLYLKSPFSVSLFGFYRVTNPAPGDLFFQVARIGQLTSFEPIKKLTPP